MTYVLIVVISMSLHGVSVSQQSYGSHDACEAARKEVFEMRPTFAVMDARCVEQH